MNVIAVSLFGTDPKYSAGLLRLIDDAAELLPDFRVQVYLDDTVPVEAMAKLEARGVRLIRMRRALGYSGTFWRMQALADRDADVVLIRDADSRITQRDVAAVQEWLASGSPFHVMRDHPRHTAEIMAGMWGARGGVGAWVARASDAYVDRERLWADQRFLRSEVYPHIRGSSCIHDSVFSLERHRRRFPTARVEGEYVGESLSAEGAYDPAMRVMCARADSSRLYRFSLDLIWKRRRTIRRLTRRR